MSDWLDLNDDQLRTEVVAMGERESGLTGGASSGFFATFFQVMGLVTARVFRVAIRPFLRFIDPQEATGFWLSLHGINAGVPRREAGATKGYLTVNSAAGGTLRAGTALSAGGRDFVTQASVRLSAGEDAAVLIQAAAAGNAGNVAPGTEVSFSSGVSPSDVTGELRAQWVTFPGHDADDDDDRYRPLVIAGYAVRGEANTEARYRLVALRVDGVSNVAVGRTPRGFGSADVAVLFERRLPTVAELALVQAAIADAGLTGRDVFAAAPTVVTVSVDVEITGTATPADVEAAIDAWWRQNIGIGDQVLVQTLYAAAASGVPGLESVVYTSPAANLPAQAGTWYRPSITVTAV